MQEPEQKPSQRIDARTHRIKVSWLGWFNRVFSLALLGGIIAYELSLAYQLNDWFLYFISMLPIHSATYMVVGWFFFRNPAVGHRMDVPVVVIVPVFNQKAMIRNTLNAIYRSSYRNIHVIVVNDGSTDGTRDVLESLKASGQYPNMVLLHKLNEGKRKAVAMAFYYNDAHIRAEYIVMVDSDSIVDKYAIEKLMKTFGADMIYTTTKPVGAVVGQAYVLNTGTNTLTKCQSAWYSFAFNVEKACQSVFGNVLCCSGCLSAYRVDAIRSFIGYWANARLKDSEDRELTTITLATKDQKKKLLEKARKQSSEYDYAEDRALTASALTEWRTLYAADAIVYTDVPENFRTFLRQQLRWKKGTLRVNWYVAMFFWRKNPVVSILIFYIDFMVAFLNPIMIVASCIYLPMVTQSAGSVAIFAGSSMLLSISHGLDYKFRDPNARYWMYKPLMNIITGFVTSWLVIPALLRMHINEWGTR